jgi:ligand-binding sensor domain-containing protein
VYRGLPAILAADLDEGGNLWAVGDNRIVYLRAPAATTFRSLTPADGLWPMQNGILAIAGGVAGEAFVGYIGCDDGVDPMDTACRQYGDMDRVRVGADGALTVHHFELHNSYDMRYDETKTIWRLVYVHDGPASGVVFAGSNHGVDRIDGDLYRDHIHAMCADSTGTFMMGNWRGLALDADANLWIAGAFEFALWGWVADPMHWLDGDSPPNHFVDGIVVRAIYPGQPCNRALAENHYGAAVTADGRVWLAARGHGLAVWDRMRSAEPARVLASGAGLPSVDLTDVVTSADGKLWVATGGGGVYLLDPATEHTVGQLTTAEGLPSNAIHTLVHVTWAGDALVVATSGGIAVLR